MTSAWSDHGDPWQGLEAQLHDAQTSAFGSRWKHIPMISRPNKTAIPDPSRAPTVACAVFVDPSLQTMARREGGFTMSSNPSLEIHRGQIADIRQHDEFVKLDGCGREIPEMRYQVTTPKDTGNGGTWKLGLVQLGLRQ